MLDPSSSEEESDELLEEERRDVLVAAGGGSPRSLPPPPRDPRGREAGAARAASPSPSVLSEGREEQERLQREEREKRLRLQLYVFIARCIAHPFNAKQPTDMARRQQKVEAILVNIFGGIVNCAIIANGITRACRELELKVPLVVRLEGTNVHEAQRILNESGLPIMSANDLEDAAKKAVASVAKK